jgi:crossover junction endodeoxyribonuclease RuvC
MTLKISSIDPGLLGAIAFFEDGQLTDIQDMPTLTVERNNKSKRMVSPNLLAEMFINAKVDHCYVERVSARPNQGVTSVFSFGRSFGVIEGILAAYQIPVTFVMPTVWTKSMARGEGKNASRARAMELYPSHSDSFKRAKDDGRADAVLIGAYGLKIYGK